MPRYVAQHAYTAKRDGQQFGPWTPGTVVELREHDAQWVNRDSPGCLAEEQPELVSAVVVEDDGERDDQTDGATPQEQEDGGEPDGVSAGVAELGDGSDEVVDAVADYVVPDGTAQVVLAWVGDDPDRARRALDAENGKEQRRTTLIATLERMASSTLDRQHRGGRNRAVGL